jgi:3-oxoacyl-[acyl-carrier-protein] synthase-1
VKLNLAVTGVGMLNPVGVTGLVALHSIRSGISRLALQPFHDRVQKWITGAAIPKWVPSIQEDRLCDLAIDAIRAALERAETPARDGQRTPTTAIILGSPEGGRPGYRFPSADIGAIRSILRDALESAGTVEVVPAGACSAQAALGRAVHLFATNSVERCVLGAVDTQLQLRTIRWHENNRRLKCAYVNDGLMPAEAACFLVVEPEELARARGAKIIARVLAVNAAREPATILSEEPNTASSLTAVVRATLADAGVSPSDVGMIWSDLNGESYRAREWAFSEVRLGFSTDTELTHPADCHGDLGAATDANLLGLAALCHGTGWSDGKATLVFSGSEYGWRAATVLAPPADGGPFLQVSKRVPRVLSTSFRVPAPPDPAEDFRNSNDPPRAYFEWQLREEHRDELASLHYQREAILHDPTIDWPRLREPEQRMLNHLDAAVMGGPASMAVVAAGAQADEEGLCFAGSLLIGTLPNSDNFALLEAACQQSTPPRLAGIAAGLLHAPPSEALDRLIGSLIDHSNPSVQAIGVSVAAKRRLDVGPRLVRLAESTEPSVAAAVSDAAWRLRVQEAAPALQRFLAHEQLDVRRAAVMALLCLVPSQTAAMARARIDSDAHFGGALATCLGIAGQLADAVLLMNRVERDPRDTGAVSALGILGAPDSISYLIGLLQSPDEEIKVAAGGALDLISGLHARERVPEIARTEDEAPTGEAHEVERVNTSVEFWTNWWHGRRGRLNPAMRWRRGAYFGLVSCIDELADPKARFADRARAYFELTARAPIALPFEPDWFVARQDGAINAWRTWLQRSTSREEQE